MKTIQKIGKITPVHTSALCKGKKGMGGVVLAGAGILLLFGGIWLGSTMMNKTPLNAGSDPVKKTTVKDTTPVSASMCGSAGTTAFDAIVLNPLDDDGTPTYTSVGMKIFEANGGGSMMSYTTDSDGTFASASLSMACPGEYVAYVPAVLNTSASGKFEFDADRAVKSLNAEIDKVDFIQARAYDNLNNANVYDSSDADATDYEDSAGASITFKSTTNNATAYAMGVGGELDWTFRVKTDTQTAWGDIENFIVVDADSSNYETPQLYFDGKPLQEVGKSALPHVDDQGYLSSYEYVFRLPADITERASDLRLVLNAKGSINPDTDVVLRFVAGSYSIDGITPRYSIFNRAGTEILMTARTFTIDIS